MNDALSIYCPRCGRKEHPSNLVAPWDGADPKHHVCEECFATITSNYKLLKLPKTRPNTIKLFDGPSLLDGKRIIVLLTGLASDSNNTKTGAMMQTWILRYDIAPHEALKTGDDSSVCGQCPLRPLLWKAAESKVSDKPCYVKTWHAPLSTWKANRDLPVTPMHEALRLIDGRMVRFGSYGDPGAVPAWIWSALKQNKQTGYSHQWRTQDVASFVMASVHSVEERAQAKAKGMRTFRIVSSLDEIVRDEKGRALEIACPASKEAGVRTTCSECGLCDGSRGPNDRRKDIVIVAH
jgi:hypothetical protein